MTSIRAAARWDARALRRSRVSWLALGILAVAVGLAVWSGLRFRASWDQEAGHEAVLERFERMQQLASAPADPWSAMPLMTTTRIAVPAAPLAELATGRADLDPRTANVSPFTHAGTLFRDYQTASPSALATGRFDLAFVIVYVLPLVIIALGFGLLSEERERGIDRLLAVHGIQLRRLVAGRVLARFVPILLPLLAGLAVLFFAGGDLTAVRAARYLATVALAAGHATFWWGVVVLVSTWRLGSSGTLVALVVTWVALVLAVPALVGAATTALHPAPSRFTLIAAARAADIGATARAAELIGGYAHDHPGLDPKAATAPPTWALRAFVVAREVDAAQAPLFDAFDRALGAQQAVVAGFQFTSPALLATRGLGALAGTNEARALAYRDQARAFLAGWREAMGKHAMTGATVNADLLGAMAPFAFAEPSLAAVLAAAAVPLAAMWVFAGVLVLVARSRLPRT